MIGFRALKQRLMWFLVDNWMELCIGMLITTTLVNLEFADRGYFTFGGEWIAPAAMVAFRKLAVFLRGIWRA